MATNSRSSRKKQRNKKKKPAWKKVFKYIGLLALLCFLVVGGLFAYFIATAPDLDPDKLDVPYAARFYDQDGELFADIGEENRVKVTYDDLPQELIDAVIATEDSRFFKHKGIDLRRIASAIKANFTRGFGSEGASTITQQVVEQMFLTPEKSIKLKVQEQWLALKLERQYSKEEILEMYLNKIFYGSNAYGVGKATEVYFGKDDLQELTLLESAMLAGLPQRPTAYNPFENPDLMQDRVDTVLKLMVRHEKISQEEADEAQATDVASVLTDKKPSGYQYDAFVQKVEKELDKKLPDVDVFGAGLKVHTTLDTNAQETVEALLTDSNDNPISYPDEDLQAGLTVLDTKTGAVQAIGGGRNREDRGYNYAFNNQGRQPGSVFKPIVAYGPAIENEKWSTYHQIDDSPIQTEGSAPIRNWDRQFHGWISMRHALEQSYNVPAAKTFNEIGSEDTKEFAEGLGIEFADEVLDPRDAYGGTRTNTTPMDLAGAYSAFGNEGIYTEPYAVTKVEFPDGSTIDLKPESEAVMSDYTAYMITDMLKSVVKNGTGTNANIEGLPLAGKTGTTNLKDKRGANNSWFSGYTTNYTVSVWTGYDESGRIIDDTQIAHALFKNTMQEISKDVETEDFIKPDSVVEANVVKGSNPPELASSSSGNTVTELFVKGTEPSRVSKEEPEELDPVDNLEASYQEDGDAIDISWNYNGDEDVSFEVQYKTDDDNDMKDLTTTEDTSVELSSIEEGQTYTIQVVAVSNEDERKSEPKKVSVDLSAEDDEEEEGEEMKVDDLDAQYNNEGIDVSWSYSGPDATFEVGINGETQSVSSTSIHLNRAEPGQTYTIGVTPIAGDTRGDTKDTSITIPEAEEENQDDDTRDQNNSSNEENESENEENEQENDTNENGNNTDEQDENNNENIS